MKKRREFLGKNSRGQLELSFGMIFSIILIVIFLSVAIYAIMKFLDLQESVKTANFVDKLENDVDKIWRGTQGAEEITYDVPTKIEKVCFIDYSSSSKGKDQNLFFELQRVQIENENLAFYPVGSGEGLDSVEIKHADIERITAVNNPSCINNNGKITLTIEKDFNENLVNIK